MSSGEEIMDGIPILEIDCNMEFHDDEEIKAKMLQQVCSTDDKHSKTLAHID